MGLGQIGQEIGYDILRPDAEIMKEIGCFIDVRYLYDEKEKDEREAAEIDMQPAEFDDLTADAIESIRRAALELSIDALTEALLPIGLMNPQVAGHIRALAREMRYDKIMELCDRALKNKSDSY